MKKLILILKGLLLWVTALLTLLFMMAIDSLYDNNCFIVALIIIATFIAICYKTIKPEEIDIISLNNYLTKKLKQWEK